MQLMVSIEEMLVCMEKRRNFLKEARSYLEMKGERELEQWKELFIEAKEECDFMELAMVEYKKMEKRNLSYINQCQWEK